MLTHVPFKNLTTSDAINARPAAKDGIDELAQSIASMGLIQPLAVRPADGGGYEVIDGRRRFQAIQRLVKAKTWKKEHEIPVLVRNEDDASALEISLAANTIRLPMHPVDQHEVFARLEAQGRKVEEIAERFAMPVRTVRQRLALGKLAQPIRDAWKKGKLDEDTAKAYAEAPSPDAQVELFERLKKSYGQSAYQVRHEIHGRRVRASSIAPAIVERYVQRGGAVADSLFEEERYLEDHLLLMGVKNEIGAAEVSRLEADGWSWVALASQLPAHWRWQWDTVDEVEVEPVYTAEEQARLAEIDAVSQSTPALDDEADRIEMIGLGRAYTAEQKARSGAVVDVTDSGRVHVTYGVIRPGTDIGDDLPDAEDDGAGDTWDDDDEDTGEDLPPVSAVTGGKAADDEGEREGLKISGALSQDLSVAKTIAAARVLARHPHQAMAFLTAALLARHDSPACIRNDGHASVRVAEGRDFAQLLPALLADPDVAKKLAAAVASTLDLTDARWKWKSRDTGVDQIVAALPTEEFQAEALKEFNPTDYFTRATKAVAIAALDEMREAGATGLAPEDIIAGMKKADLAAAAAKTAQETGWLPPELRHPRDLMPGAYGPSAEAA